MFVLLFIKEWRLSMERSHRDENQHQRAGRLDREAARTERTAKTARRDADKAHQQAKGGEPFAYDAGHVPEDQSQEGKLQEHKQQK